MLTRRSYAAAARPPHSVAVQSSPPSPYISRGRAITEIGNDRVDVDAIAIEGSRAWVRANLHAVDSQQHTQFRQVVQSGSQDLQSLFSRRARNGAPLENDTSIGVGYAPLSRLEKLVLEIERTINHKDRLRTHPAWGEDIKVMGIRSGDRVTLTIACAMAGNCLAHMDDYLEQIEAIDRLARGLAARHGFSDCEIRVNAADNPEAEVIYLTVTGTSAEGGDDGQVGRGNRLNGLITPCRPMSLEAAAGKNPVSHVGKLYNILAHKICTVLEHGVF